MRGGVEGSRSPEGRVSVPVFLVPAFQVPVFQVPGLCLPDSC